MSKARLTPRQKEALEAVRSLIRLHQTPPTLREIGKALGLASNNSVYKLVRALEEKGYVTRDAKVARSICVVEDVRKRTPSLSVVSRTNSRRPEDLRRRALTQFSIDQHILRDASPQQCFIARVEDDGMSGDGIVKGDLVVVQEVSQNEVSNGEMVAALVEDDVRIRRYLFSNDRIHLRPSSAQYSTDVFAPDDPACHIAGRVISLLRRF